MSTTTGIQRVDPDSKDQYMFVRLEDVGHNRYIKDKATTDVGNCWVSWCNSETELLKRGIIITNQTKGTLVGYVWQDKDSTGDDRVRFSKSGWGSPAPSNRISGFSKVGTKINLKIDASDNVSAEEASPN